MLRPLWIGILGLVLWSDWAGAAAGQEVAEPGDRGAIVIPDGWEYRWGDAPADERGLPAWAADTVSTGWQPASTLLAPPGEAQDFLWLRTRLPEALPDRPALGIPFAWMGLEVYLDGVRLYRSGTPGPDPQNKYQVLKPHLIALPTGAGGGLLTLRLYSNYGEAIGIPDAVYLGSEAGLLQYALRNDLGTLIIGVVLVLVGVLTLSLLARVRDRQHTLLLLYLGLFAFCFGINYVCLHYVVFFVVDAPRLLYYLAGLFFLFPVGLLGFFEQVVGAGYRSVIRRLWQAHLVFWTVGIVLDVMNVLPIWMLSPVFFGMLAVSLLVMTATVVPAMRGGHPEARIIGVGMLVAIVLGLFDTIFQGLFTRFDLPSLSPWGVLILMLFLGYLLERRFSGNMRQLQAAHAQLEEYNATLEHRVDERTRALSHKNRELAEMLQEVKSMQNQLIQSEKLASLGQLTAGIAHEIKNPLNFVTNFSQLSVELADELEAELSARRRQPVEAVLDDLQDLLDDLKTNATKIHEHGRRADDIVRSMLLHSRGKPGERRPTDLNALLDEYVNLAYHGMRARHADFNATLERVYDASVGEVELVPQEVGRVLLNLLNNAFYAVHQKAAAGGDGYAQTVQVRTRRDGDRVEIRVRDNGGGIPEALRTRVFEPFFTTKPPGEGTGLGLSLAYDIVTRGHGGTMTVENTDGEGVTFVITLPG